MAYDGVGIDVAIPGELLTVDKDHGYKGWYEGSRRVA
jgi:hypothetical protein